MRGRTRLFSGLVALCAAIAAVPAFADSVAVNFESPAYAPGDINGQDGWTKTGSYDVAVVNNTYGYASFGSQSLRLSNATTSGRFGDQTFAKPLTDAVGEAEATDGGFSEGNRKTFFQMQFDIASAVPTAQQPGLFMSVSPDRGDGSRMSYLSFTDGTDGIDVTFYDVPGTSNPANFVGTKIAALDRSAPHTIKLTLNTFDGPSNDIVKVYIDGTLVHTGTSWENYYRYDSEAAAEPTPRIVKTVLFRESGTAAPATAGNGFLVDNLTLSSSNPPNLLGNGSFESGPSGNYQYIKGGQTTIDNWTTTQNGVERFNPAIYGWGAAEDGTYAIDLAPYIYTGGGIQQQVPTQKGNYYQLTFYGTTTNYQGRDGTGQVDVLLNGILKKSVSLVNHSGTVNWQPYTLDFQATGSTTTIAFQNNQDPYLHFALVDGVSLKEMPPPADLTVDQVTINPSPVAVNQDATLSATVTNNGNRIAKDFDIALYKNLATPPTSGQTPDATCHVASLEPGATTSTPCTTTVSYGSVETAIAWAVADYQNTVYESAETNNTGHRGVAVMLPDLYITKLAVSPTTAVLDSGSATVNFTATVENISAVQALGSFRVDLYSNLPGAPSVGQHGDQSCTINGLAPAGSGSTTTPVTATCTGTLTYTAAGTYNIWAQVDTDNTVVEAHEDNNVIGPAAQSVINTYTLTLNTAGNGSGTVTGGGTYNDGQTVGVIASAATGSTFTGWTGPDAQECSGGAVLVNADKSCTANFALKTFSLTLSKTGTGSGTVTPAGTTTYNYGDVVTVSATPANGSTLAGWSGTDAAECTTGQVTMDGNKSCTATFDASASPADLVVSALSANPSPVAVGQAVTLTATVTNNGGTAAGAFEVAFYKNLSSAPGVNDAGDASCQISSLAAGASASCQATVTYSAAGLDIVWAQADEGNTVTESNDGNNTRHIGLSVRQPADLTITTWKALPSTTTTGSNVTLLAYVHNGGGVAISTPFKVDFYKNSATAPDGSVPGDVSCTISSLGAGGTALCRGTVQYSAAGTFQAWALADRTNAVTESDETNNSAVLTMTVTSP